MEKSDQAQFWAQYILTIITFDMSNGFQSDKVHFKAYIVDLGLDKHWNIMYLLFWTGVKFTVHNVLTFYWDSLYVTENHTEKVQALWHAIIHSEKLCKRTSYWNFLLLWLKLKFVCHFCNQERKSFQFYRYRLFSQFSALFWLFGDCVVSYLQIHESYTHTHATSTHSQIAFKSVS